MTTAVANPQDQSLRQFLVYSIIMHASLAVVMVVSAYIQFRDNRWGGVGGELGGTKVTLVPAAGIPMPKESVVKDSKAVDPTKGLYKEEPPKPPEPKTDATKIPKFEKEKPLPPSRPSRTLENKTPIPDNAVRYGKAGTSFSLIHPYVTLKRFTASFPLPSCTTGPSKTSGSPNRVEIHLGTILACGQFKVLPLFPRFPMIGPPLTCPYFGIFLTERAHEGEEPIASLNSVCLPKT